MGGTLPLAGYVDMLAQHWYAYERARGARRRAWRGPGGGRVPRRRPAAAPGPHHRPGGPRRLRLAGGATPPSAATEDYVRRHRPGVGLERRLRRAPLHPLPRRPLGRPAHREGRGPDLRPGPGARRPLRRLRRRSTTRPRTRRPTGSLDEAAVGRRRAAARDRRGARGLPATTARCSPTSTATSPDHRRGPPRPHAGAPPVTGYARCGRRPASASAVTVLLVALTIMFVLLHASPGSPVNSLAPAVAADPEARAAITEAAGAGPAAAHPVRLRYLGGLVTRRPRHLALRRHLGRQPDRQPPAGLARARPARRTVLHASPGSCSACGPRRHHGEHDRRAGPGAHPAGPLGAVVLARRALPGRRRPAATRTCCPSAGGFVPFRDDPAANLQVMILPALVLGLAAFALVARSLRAVARRRARQRRRRASPAAMGMPERQVIAPGRAAQRRDPHAHRHRAAGRRPGLRHRARRERLPDPRPGPAHGHRVHSRRLPARARRRDRDRDRVPAA